MKKLLILCCISSILLGNTYPKRVKLAKDIIANDNKIAILTKKKRTAEAQLGVLNTTRELQRVIESTAREIDELKAQTEVLLLIKYEEGPQLKDIVQALKAKRPVS